MKDLAAVTFILLFLGTPLLMFQESSPATTLLFVMVSTAYARRRRITCALTITGLVFYGASWIVAARCGYWAGVPFWTSGILAWFTGVYLSLPKQYRMIRAAV